MKKKIISALVAFSCVLAIGGYAYYDTNRYELVQDTVIIELGKTLDVKKPEKFVSGNPNRVKETVFDASALDTAKVGRYKVKASCKGQELIFEVQVEDTKAPTVKLKNEGKYKVVAGKELSAKDIVDSYEDLAGIKEVTVKDTTNLVEKEQSEDLLSNIVFSYSEAGVYNNIILITDNNDNTDEKEIEITVIEDYLAHVQGIPEELTVEQNSENINWTEGITYDEKVVKVEGDASAVDLSTPGEYELTLKIHGDDEKTIVEKKVKVTVVEPEKAQALANEGGVVKATGGNKAAYTGSASSSSGRGNNGYSNNYGSSSSGRGSSTGGSYNQSSGSSSSNGSAAGGGSSNNNSAGTSGKPAGSTGTGTTTDSGYIGNGSSDTNGNTYEEGEWGWD